MLSNSSRTCEDEVCSRGLAHAWCGSDLSYFRYLPVGAAGSWISMIPCGDGPGLPHGSPTMQRPHPFHPDIKVVALYQPYIACREYVLYYSGGHTHTHSWLQVRRGVLADECSACLKAFFKRRRKENKEEASLKLQVC